MMSKIEFLSQTQLFHGLELEHYQALANITQLQVYEKGEFIFAQGDPGIGFFIILQGRVKVFQVSLDGKEQILKVFGWGENFAEVPAFDGGYFPASAMTIEQSQLLFFPRTEMLKLIQNYPKIGINLLAIFAKHLRQFTQLIADLSLKDVPARLAAYLLNLNTSNPGLQCFELDMSKSQLAALLGTIPETLSRAFAKLSQEQLIKITGSSIQVLDRQGLKQRAGDFNLSLNLINPRNQSN